MVPVLLVHAFLGFLGVRNRKIKLPNDKAAKLLRLLKSKNCRIIHALLMIFFVGVNGIACLNMKKGFHTHGNESPSVDYRKYSAYNFQEIVAEFA